MTAEWSSRRNQQSIGSERLRHNRRNVGQGGPKPRVALTSSSNHHSFRDITTRESRALAPFIALVIVIAVFPSLFLCADRETRLAGRFQAAAHRASILAGGFQTEGNTAARLAGRFQAEATDASILNGRFQVAANDASIVAGRFQREGNMGQTGWPFPGRSAEGLTPPSWPAASRQRVNIGPDWLVVSWLCVECLTPEDCPEVDEDCETQTEDCDEFDLNCEAEANVCDESERTCDQQTHECVSVCAPR